MQSEDSPVDSRRQWHRLFGLLLTDYLADSPFIVELEKDLSRRLQLLDVVIVRRQSGIMARPLPDGLNDLAAYNLITFKSHSEALLDWSLKELTGHYVNYRKQVKPRGPMLPEDQFRLFAVCARYPRELFSVVPPESIQQGVYVCRRATDAIRIIVAAELPEEEQNSLLHLFSAAPDRVKYGAEHHRLQSADTSTIVRELFGEYQIEGLNMPYTMKDFHLDIARKYQHELTTDERLAGLSAGELLNRFSSHERLEGLSPKEIEAYLKTIQGKSNFGTKQKRKNGRRPRGGE